MFWRFGIQNASAIDTLLDKDSVSFDDLFAEEELLQECKAHNSKLVDFLAKPENLSRILLLTIDDDLPEEKKFKYPYLASEVICCEIPAVCDGIVADQTLLDAFWKFLDRPQPINPLLASYFSKVNGLLIQKKIIEMIEYVRQQPNLVDRLLRHIANASIAELLLKIISVEEMPEAQGIVKWLCDQGLIPKLIDRLDPNLEVEVHNTASQSILDIIAVSYQNIAAQEAAISSGEAISMEGSSSLVDQLKSAEIIRKMVSFMLDGSAPNAASTLANGINIMIEIIRRYCSEIEQAEYQQHQFQQQMLSPRSGSTFPTDEKVQVLATDLIELLRVVGERVEEMAILLDHPRNSPSFSCVSGGVVPLGSERLKTCELFAEILHLQYLYYSSPLFERMVDSTAVTAPSAPPAPTASADPAAADSQPEAPAAAPDSTLAAAPDGAVEGITDGLAELKLAGAPATAAALRSNVADELVGVTERFVKAKVLPMCLKLFFEFPWNNFLHSVVYDMIAKVFNTYSYTATTSYIRVAPELAPTVDQVDADGATDGDKPPPVDQSLHIKMLGVKACFKQLVLS
ncbi:hypothetical protein HK405_010070, partial [Cladochytrium tenue]